ncbi:uncharacterized protein LOC143341186 [Colletes latitarsis]|uniref:uncharacterized protein LOC143341186 n=1 Tax=Colletes latitarsis TaxID=2605962 RepID=UPI00403515F0
MYILRGLRIEFDQNVRVLENQREVSMNDIRYALKQEEEGRERRKGERVQRDPEGIRKAKNKPKSEIHCFNCGKRGHMANECHGKLKCFTCQKFGHISAECKETRNNKPCRGGKQRGGFQSRGHWERGGRGYGRREAMMKSSEETVMTVSDRGCVSKTFRDKGSIRKMDVKSVAWLLDSGCTSHMTYDEEIFEKLEDEAREITLADKEGRKLTSSGIGEVLMKQESVENKVR